MTRRNPLRKICLISYISAVFALVLNAQSPVESLKLPDGFSMAVYARGIRSARSLDVTRDGTVFAGANRDIMFYAVPDSDQDGRADKVIIFRKGLSAPPNGIAVMGNDVYVAEPDRVLRYQGLAQSLDPDTEPRVILSSLELPEASDSKLVLFHKDKYLKAGPDSLLYIAVASPCNSCEPVDSKAATIMRFSPGAPALSVDSRGVRSCKGMSWHPQTHELWFTDASRMWLSDNTPPDELNRLIHEGAHYGFPYCYGSIRDPAFPLHNCSGYVKPVLELNDHVSASGMIFYTGDMFPPEYRNSIIIAEHGHWNSTRKIGYQITSVRLDSRGSVVAYELMVHGWNNGIDAPWGHPVDLIQMPDGAVVVSDDHYNVLYRISYSKAFVKRLKPIRPSGKLAAEGASVYTIQGRLVSGMEASRNGVYIEDRKGRQKIRKIWSDTDLSR